MSKYDPIASERASKLIPESREEAAALAADICAHHAPVDEQLKRIAGNREHVTALVIHLLMTMPPCPERSTAIAKARECLMWANAGVIFTPVQTTTPVSPFPS